MASKLGVILSLSFFAMAMFIGADILRLQFLHSALEAFSISLGEKIAIEGRITDSMVQLAESKYGATLTQVSEGSPMVGEFYEFMIAVDYTPIIISKEVMTISVTRMVLIGYMD